MCSVHSVASALPSMGAVYMHLYVLPCMRSSFKWRTKFFGLRRRAPRTSPGLHSRPASQPSRKRMWQCSRFAVHIRHQRTVPFVFDQCWCVNKFELTSTSPYPAGRLMSRFMKWLSCYHMISCDITPAYPQAPCVTDSGHSIQRAGGACGPAGGGRQWD
jgi:hypothetical protein